MALTDSTHTIKERLLKAIVTGDEVDLRAQDPRADDPASGREWGAQRTVPASLLVELLTTTDVIRRRGLQLAGARIMGRLDLGAVEIDCPIQLRGCWFEWPMRVTEATIPSLRLPGCHMPTLYATQLATRGDLELVDGFTTQMVDLSRAKIGGLLRFREANLINPDGYALNAINLTVENSVYFERNFRAEGLINLHSAGIGSNLEITDCQWSLPGGVALDAQRITVGQDVFFQRGFEVEGGLDLRGARIGGNLNFVNAKLDLSRETLLDLNIVTAGALVLGRLTDRPQLMDLRDAKVGWLVNDTASWPRQVRLQGFAYDALVDLQAPISVPTRLRWLRSDPDGYSPQPYEQLATVYRRSGRDQDARTVAIAKHRARRRALANQRGRRRILTLPSTAWSILLDVLVGYGYRTWLAVLWLSGFVLAGWLIFDRAHRAHLLVAIKEPGERPWFHAAVYALDLLLPFVDLGYQNTWAADEWARAYYLVWNLVGWVLITAIVAALGGLVRRD